MRGSSRRVLHGLCLVLLVLTLLPAAVDASPAGEPARLLPARSGSTIEIRADSFGLPLSDHPSAKEYDRPSVLLRSGDRIQFKVDIRTQGSYTLWVDCAALDDFINAPEGQWTVDGKFPLEDFRRVVFPIFFKDVSNTFPLDRYGNQVLIDQERLIRWSQAAMRDVNYSGKYPLQIDLPVGEHTFEFQLAKGSMLVGSVYLKMFTPPPGYAEYLSNHPGEKSSGVLITLEAELPSFKNDTSVRPGNSRSLEVTPYDTYALLRNMIGGESWQRSGTAVYYEFDVPQDGYYGITLREIQNTKNNFTVFRRITINDEVLFDELNEVAFGYSNTWKNMPLGEGTPYQFFLRKGKNVLGIEANNSPYRRAIEKIQKVLIDINTLALKIKKLSGNQVDPNKEWVISDYIPDIQEQLVAITQDLEADLGTLKEINLGGSSQEILSYQMAIDNIRFLAQDPDKIPVRLNRFSEGAGSAAQLLGKILPSLQSQPLALDKIFIHSFDTPPRSSTVALGTSLSEGVKRFFHSFAPDPYQSIGSAQDEIEVWVNRPRQYVDLLQTLTDQSFTPKTGIKVKFSIMPDEAKLVLANAAGIQPDVALGVSTNVPYELAIRNALKDLRSFEDFDQTIRVFSPGALLSYIINDSAYALPETQDFWVTYYRKDILDSVGIPVPKTWNQVIEILPELQRYGMNFNTPLSSGSGVKGYLITAPYLFNFGAQLYSPDGFSTGLNSEQAINAINFMTESFTIYGMPLTTANFYDSFRYGNLPLGVSNFETYIKLLTAAPEINGLWGIDLYPATVLPDGTQNRWATGSAQASIMFSATRHPQESWQFMKWWMSTETQMEFQQQLILNYGIEYLWNSANLEAFSQLPIPQQHKDVILEQWKWLQEPVKLPGSYMQERELSNAWNRVVFDGANSRVAIDAAVVTINREITRKMEEFGYLRDGVKVKEFKIPTIETVKGWMEAGK